MLFAVIYKSQGRIERERERDDAPFFIDFHFVIYARDEQQARGGSVKVSLLGSFSTKRRAAAASFFFYCPI